MAKFSKIHKSKKEVKPLSFRLGSNINFKKILQEKENQINNVQKQNSKN